MEKKRNGQVIAIVVLAVALLVMTIGFAGYTRDLELNGTVNVGSSTWDIHFDNTSYQETTGSVAATSKTIDNTTMTWNVTLSKPGDFYEFSIDVLNTGDFNAKLDAITLSALTEAQQKYLSYKVTYGTTTYTTTQTGITNISLPKTTGKETVKVRVEYLVPSDAADLPTEGASGITLNATLSYSQVTE